MDQDKSATQECYEFLDLSDVDDTERNQLATTLYPSEKQQAHVSWVHGAVQGQHHRQQQQNLGGFVGSEGVLRVAPQSGEGSCRQEIEHDPAVINSWQESTYVNGNNYEKTPSETETESSVTTEYTEFVHHQHHPPPPSHQAPQHQPPSTEMSPHQHHQHQTPHQSQQSSAPQHANLAAMYTSGGQGAQPAYLPQGSHMYQMVQPTMPPGNVYVGNMTANVNVHSFLGPQGYLQPASAFMPGDVAPQTVVATSHDQAAVHQPPMGSMRMGGPRRGRGNKSGGSHRRAAERQEQHQRQQQQQQQQQNSGAPPQELMQPPMIDPQQQMMGGQGYGQPHYYYTQYPNYYTPHTAISHAAAQHAAGPPLYHTMPLYPGGHQMAYGHPPSMFMYPPTMMSPEYAMIDDKGDEQMGDGNLMGQMWHQQMPMEYPIEPGMGAAQAQEEFMVQPELLEDPMSANALMMMSPQQTPAQPSSHHVLNPDVANFITIEQQQQMKAQQSQQVEYPQKASPVKSLPIAAVVPPSASPIPPTPAAPEELKMPQTESEQSAQAEIVVAVENVVKIEAPVEAPPNAGSMEAPVQKMIKADSEPPSILTNVTNIQNVPSVAPNNNNNNVIKPMKQEETNRLVKMTNDKLMIKNDRGQKPPAWNKKSTTSVSVTALPSPAPITTSQTPISNADVKQAKASPPPFANQKPALVKTLSNATAQVPKVIENYTKAPNQNEQQNPVAPTEVVAEKKAEVVLTAVNKTVQAIPMAHNQVSVEAKPATVAVTTFESKQVEVLPQIQPQIVPVENNVVPDLIQMVTTNGTATDCVAIVEKKLEPAPRGGPAAVTVTASAPPSKSWASLFSSDNSSASSMLAGSHPLSANKKPVAKVPPFEATQTLPIDGLSYSAASAMGLPMTQASSSKVATVAVKATKSTVDDRSFKLGEFFSKYQIDNSSVILCPRGLTNRSNFCYINAILQALVACPPFYHMMKKIPLEPPAFRQKSATPIIDAMVELVSEFSTMPPGARLGKREKGSKGKDEIDLMCDMAFEPTVIHKMLSSSRSEFHVEGRQEDAEEFLGFILNGLNDEMLELMKLVDKQANLANGEQQANGEVQTEEGGDDWQVIYGNRNKGTVTRTTDFGRTPISDIFGGQLRSRVQREGDHSTDVIQPFFTLQLDIEKAESVKEALEILVVKDQLEGVTCSKTNQEVAAWQQVTLEKLPVVLILHLKWFDYKMDSCTKILKTVEFPIELRIDAKILSSKKCVPKQRQYKLFAVVYHDGKEASKGHYITDVFNVGYASWIRYDDSTVRSVSEQTVLHPHLPKVPYLLYYRRCDTIGPQGQQSTAAK
ncbi:uncharacterized protein LOC132260691 isoform X2 [Phlebotomus argentipes]|uniref:uncharacterized protein LOC132260691 isoform X2 n=1 Tax=Phlebotomus argentipes TaxID=94469 RepID=UPI002892AF6D|nr:uncharacterized protein LOC132260691 isoform X2 [Phlebotomus argentipes]